MASSIRVTFRAHEWRQLTDVLRAARQKMPKEVLAPASEVLEKLAQLEKQHRTE